MFFLIKENYYDELVAYLESSCLYLRVNRSNYSLYVGTIDTYDLDLTDVLQSLSESYEDIDFTSPDKDLVEYLLRNCKVPIYREVSYQ